MIKVSTQTFGCKLNFAETTHLIDALTKRNFMVTDDVSMSDIHIIHSCTVTAQAEKKCRQAIRRASKLNPNIKIIVLGCYTQLRADELKDLPNVKFICGNERKFDLFNIIQNISEETVVVKEHIRDFSYHAAISNESRTRTFIKIQDGCDYYCTFCAIPYARGHSRSDNIENIVNSICKVVEAGTKEIVITGVNLGEFGKHNNESLYELLIELTKLDKLKRIRISSIEPNLLTNEIIELASKDNNIMPHFHIPLQAGTDKILKLMKRKYNTSFFADKINQIKTTIPDSCIAVDLITGFPGETDNDFLETVSFIKSLPISYLHIFSYSDRPEAISSRYPGKNDNSVIKERSKILHKVSNQLYKEFVSNYINSYRDVLYENKNKSGYWSGWTDNYIRVETKSNENLKNIILNSKISKFIPVV